MKQEEERSQTKQEKEKDRTEQGGKLTSKHVMHVFLRRSQTERTKGELAVVLQLK